ncbi:MAG: hypothetical protein ACK4J1_07810 [Hylemonella sp.]
MDEQAEERAQQLEQLCRLMTVAQDLARQLADHSHGRAYDKVRDLNELLHLARLQLNAISADGLVCAPERRRTARPSPVLGPDQPV